MKIAVISGRFPQTTFNSFINHKVYCDTHNLTYIHCNWPTTQNNPYLNKIEYILSYFDFFDYIFWIDDDAYFVDSEKDLKQFLPPDDKFLSICKSPIFKPIKTYYSSGQFFIRCCAKAKLFLKTALETDLQTVREWWPEHLGFFSNGDQDIFIYLAIEKNFEQYIEAHEYYSFNCRIEDLRKNKNIFLIHFTGKMNIKKKHFSEAQKILGQTSSLLPQALLESYPSTLITLKKKCLKWIKKKLHV